jgi:hypothetical protein
MADNKTDNLFSQLDNAEKHDIITDEELEEIGVAYGSREKYEETMRYLASRLSGTQTRRHAFVSVGNGRNQAKINQGTSTVPLGDLSGIKKINIAGRVINTAGDAALLLSSFLDPRMEIFNIVYTSKTGEILAHTAWTNGLPGFAYTVDRPSPGEGISRILKIKENLNADKIWIAHNHPSGDPAPSDQDIGTTRTYASRFGNSFSGHIVLDHNKYTFIFPDGMFYEYELEKPSINFISTIREQAETIKSPAHFASIFKEILSGNEDTTAYAILDNAHKIVSWIYGNSGNTAELKNYMRISGGSSAVALTNDETAYRKIFNNACNAFDSNKDIFLDVIKVDKSTGIAEKCLAERVGTGGKWQLHESKQVKYIINNQSLNVQFDLKNISNNNPSVYEDQENFYIKDDIVKQISNKEQIMEKRIILAKADDELTEEQMRLFSKDIDFIEACIKAEEQKDWNRVDQLLKERRNQPDAKKGLRTTRYNQLIHAWEKETYRQSDQLRDHLAAQKKVNQVNQLINEKAEVQADGSLRISSEDWRGINRKLNEKNIEKNKMFEDTLRGIASKTPHLEMRNINSKENFMSDENENEGQTRDPQEEAFRTAVQQTNTITNALKAGELSCLPGDDGFADTQPAVNLVSGSYYHGEDLLFLKEHQKENGFPTAEYVAYRQIENAKKENPDLFIRKGQQGVSIYANEVNEKTGEAYFKNYRLFNVAQLNKPNVMKEWAEQQQQKELQNKLEFMQKQYGTGYKLPEPKQKDPGPEIVCSSTEPKEYLGQYLAAVSLGGKFKVSKEQAAEFAQKLEGTLSERLENGFPDPFKLRNISVEANQHCKEVIKETRIEARKAEQPQQQQEQTQSRGRSM